MGLETSTYISGLTASWPPSGDPKSQGDDHLRLIKGVLQATFPNATKALYIPKCETVLSGPMVLDATDQNNLIQISTSGGDVAVTLPGGLTTTDNGWSCEIFKNTTDANAIIVSPTSSVIYSQVGGTATIRIGTFCIPARFIWTGNGWLCVKPGPIVGSTFNWDGAAVPNGCLVLNGSTFSGVAYAELNLALGTTTLRDKRDRVEVGYGLSYGLGGVYGATSVSLALGNLPNHIHSGTTSAASADHTHTQVGSAANISANIANIGNGVFGYVNYGAIQTGGQSTGHTHTMSTDTLAGANATPFGIIQPSIGTQKLIRAC